jgi:hypothetical protein
VHRTLNGIKVVRIWYNNSVEAICLISHEPYGLQASAGRGFSPPTCTVLYCSNLLSGLGACPL